MKKPRQFKKIIFEELDQKGLGHLKHKIKSMRYETFSMGNALRIECEDVFKNDRVILENIFKSYEYGRFDGMTDYAWSEHDKTKERQAKYVTTCYEYSDGVENVVKAYLKAHYGVFDDKSCMDRFNNWYPVEVHQRLSSLKSYEDLQTMIDSLPHQNGVENQGSAENYLKTVGAV